MFFNARTLVDDLLNVLTDRRQVRIRQSFRAPTIMIRIHFFRN